MASAVVSAEISMIRRARATTLAADDSAGSPAIDRLTRRRAPETFMASPSALPAPTSTSVSVAPDEAGERLDRLLARHLPGVSRSRLKTLIEAGMVELNGHTIRNPSHRVNSGSAIKVDVPPPRSARPGPEPIPLKVVYEDDDIIVIDKPAGLVVHPAAGNWTGTLVNALIAHCGDSLSGVGGVKRPGIVHRLDKDTSGLMVVAKTDRAHRALARQFADHGRSGALRRGYLAFVWGVPERPRGTIDKPIGRHH